MSQEEVTEHLEELLRLQQIETSKAAASFIEAFSQENIHEKRSAAQRLIDELENIKRLAPKFKVPSWLDSFRDKLFSYAGSKIESKVIAEALIEVIPEIRKHKWTLKSTPPQGFDFEEIFDQCRNESRVPELFDEIIKLLEQIRDSGHLDSRAMEDALTKVIATLETGKHSTFFSFDGAWHFLSSFLQNYFWAEAEKIPFLGTAMEALRKTIDEVDIEISTLRSNVNKKVSERVTNEVKLFQRSPTPLSIYGANGYLLEDRSASSKITEA